MRTMTALILSRCLLIVLVGQNTFGVPVNPGKGWTQHAQSYEPTEEDHLTPYLPPAAYISAEEHGLIPYGLTEEGDVALYLPTEEEDLAPYLPTEEEVLAPYLPTEDEDLAPYYPTEEDDSFNSGPKGAGETVPVLAEPHGDGGHEMEGHCGDDLPHPGELTHFESSFEHHHNEEESIERGPIPPPPPCFSPPCPVYSPSPREGALPANPMPEEESTGHPESVALDSKPAGLTLVLPPPPPPPPPYRKYHPGVLSHYESDYNHGNDYWKEVHYERYDVPPPPPAAPSQPDVKTYSPHPRSLYNWGPKKTYYSAGLGPSGF